MPRFACALLLGLLLQAPAFSQNISGAITGRVEDPTGAPLAAASVALTSTQTGFTRAATANENGYFAFRDLGSGLYDLAITAPGFKRYSQSSIELTSGEQKALPTVHMQLGELAEAITVTAEAATVQLGSGERAGVMTAAEMEKMALKGRDFMDAVGLLAGVVDLADGREAPGADSIGNIYIMGGRSNQKNLSIDGVTNLDTGSNGSAHGMPSIDSIGEVKVLMSNFAAEYGRNSGGAITVITKGGGKQFRGAAGWYHRHENYSANDFFNNQRGVSRPPYRYNIFSYTLSGPIYIPGRFNRRREKLFFFWSQEFQEQLVNFGSRTVTVPTALERAGDFSQTYDVNGRRQTIYDPDANQTPFPGNVIPSSRHTKIGQAILNLFPLPNFTDPNPSRRYQWNYVSALSGPYPRRTEIARVDYNISQKWIAYFRFNHNIEQQEPPFGVWVAGSVNFPLTPTLYRRPGRGATAYSTYSISPTMFSETILGVSQNKLFFYPAEPEKVSRKATGILIPQWNPDLNPDGYIPNMTFGGVPNAANPSMSNGIPYYNSNTIFSVVQNFTRLAGSHTLKFGAYFERTRKDQSASVATRGAVQFDRNRNNPVDTNWAYANALIGSYLNYSEANARLQGQFRFSNFETYIQDAWRVRRGLLVDYGLRIYADHPQYDARHQLASFIPALWDPAKAPVLLRPALNANNKKAALDPLTGKTYPEGLIGTFVPGVGDPANGMVIGGVNGWPRGLYTMPAVSLAPRAGFAWDPFGRGRTAIRGGAGVYFDRIQGNPTMGLLSNPPTILTPSVYYGYLANLGDAAGKGILAPNATTTSMLGHHSAPTVYNFSLGVQQQLARHMILDISYAGTLGRHLLWQRNINPVPIGARHIDIHPENRDPTAPTRPLPDNFLRPLQGFGNINMFEFASTSNYNALLVSFDKRMSKGLSLGFVYTFSKVLGAASTDTTTVSAFFDPRRRNYGPLTYDRTHIASVRAYYQIPRPGKALNHRKLAYLTDGWELSSIARFSSGAAFTPGYALVSGTDITGTPNESARVVVLPGPALPDTERFAPPERGTFGNAGAGILRGPGFANLDLSLYRVLKLTERRTLQLRFESYNTLNHTQFSGVSQTARFDAAGAQIDPLFLQPTSSRSPRRVQLALRLNF